MLNIFYDADFTVKSLEPKFTDNSETPVQSPLTLTTTATELVLDEGCKFINILILGGSANNVEVRLKKGTIIAGSLTLSGATTGTYKIPTENVTHVLLVADASTVPDVSFFQELLP